MIDNGTAKTEILSLENNFCEFPIEYSHPAWPFHLKPSRKTGRATIPKRILHQPYIPSRTGPCEKSGISINIALINKLLLLEVLNQKPKHPPEREEPPQKPEPNIPDQPGKPIPPEWPEPNKPDQPTPPERPDKPYKPNQPDKPTPPGHPTKPDQPNQPVA